MTGDILAFARGETDAVAPPAKPDLPTLPAPLLPLELPPKFRRDIRLGVLISVGALIFLGALALAIWGIVRHGTGPPRAAATAPMPPHAVVATPVVEEPVAEQRPSLDSQDIWPSFQKYLKNQNDNQRHPIRHAVFALRSPRRHPRLHHVLTGAPNAEAETRRLNAAQTGGTP